jgi:hypothetical protein
MDSAKGKCDMDHSTAHRRIDGSCHCGNISFEFVWPDADPTIPVRACGCSMCTKHRGVWTSHPLGRFRLRIGDDTKVTRYRFGTRTARYAVVNVNTFDNVDRSQLVESATDFEGESTESRLARRRRNWTPEAVG